MSFVKELKRRNVFRVGAAYVVVSWLTIQIADVMGDSLDFPDWFMPMVFVVLALGFPLALIISWAFELTPQGLKKTAEVDSDDSITPSTGKRLDRLIIVVLILALGYFVWESRFSGPGGGGRPGGGAGADRSIAVLPFTDLSAEGDREYFADGISEEILNMLVKIPDLRVVGRTSSFQFKGQALDLRQIGHDLGVAHVLEGSVRTSGNRVRITAQLVETETGFHLWSETYDRELTDIFLIQDQISRAIAEALELTMGGSEARMVAEGTESVEAYALYLKGLVAFADRGVTPIENAISLFSASVIFDPGFAAAHASLALAYALEPNYGGAYPNDITAARAKHHAARALALGPEEGRAWFVDGVVRMIIDFDFEGAETSLLRAAESLPNSADVANFLGDLYIRGGQWEQGEYWERRAMELDPLSPVHVYDLAFGLQFEGRLDEAAELAVRLKRLSPDNSNTFTLDANLISARGDAKAMEALISDWLSRPPERLDAGFSQLLRSGVPDLAILRGDAAQFRADMERLVQHLDETATAAADLAQYYVKAGLVDEAVDWLEFSDEQREPSLFYAVFISGPEQFPGHARWQALWARPRLARLAAWRAKHGLSHPGVECRACVDLSGDSAGSG